jgi:AcrR family transcriptional regulator
VATTHPDDRPLRNDAERPLRKDAERNRRRILDAANELFAEQGLHVTLDAVAARAGVGVGTVYRRFADKEALIDALFEARIDEVVAVAERALACEDPWTGVVQFFDEAMELHVADRGLKEVIFTTAHGRDRVAGARERIKPIVTRVVQCAKDSGALRGDFETTDVPIIQLMLTAVMEYTGDADDVQVWRRCLVLVLDGMRASPGACTALPCTALSDAQLDVAMARCMRPPPRR